MPRDNGKVIVSLLAGATAGVVAGLLLAPETGEEARAGLRRSAAKWGGSLGKYLQDALGKTQGNASAHTNPDAAVSEDRTAADALLDSMSRGGSAEPGDLATSARTGAPSVGGRSAYAPDDDNDLDYDGTGGDARHRADL